MKSTKHLTGFDTSRYHHKLQPLALLRVNDMRANMKNIADKSLSFDKGSDEYMECVEHFQDVQKAVDFWQELLDEK